MHLLLVTYQVWLLFKNVLYLRGYGITPNTFSNFECTMPFLTQDLIDFFPINDWNRGEKTSTPDATFHHDFFLLCFFEYFCDRKSFMCAALAD